jgi:hypothetical protein
MDLPPPRSRRSAAEGRLPDAGLLRRAGWLGRLALGLVHPVVLIFFIAALLSQLTGDPVRAAYFLVIGFALAWDRAIPRTRPVSRDTAAGDVVTDSTDSAGRLAAIGQLVAFGGLVSVGYAVVVGEFRPYSVPATISVTALAAAAVFLAWRTSADSAAPPPRLDPAGVAAWVVLGLAAGAWELVALYMQPTLTTDSTAHPTLSYLATGLLRAWSGRSAFLLAWLAFGWYLVRLRATR